MVEYRFNKAQHLHQLLVEGEWKNLTGCTTVTGILNKPKLIGWAANMAVDHIKNHADPVDVETGFEEKTWEKLLEEARTAHQRSKERSGSYGTQTHDLISNIIKHAIDNNVGLLPDIDKSENISVQNFIVWAREKKVKFLDTERNIYSKNLFIGGIVDFVCEIEGEVWIGDIKTAKSGLYAENFWQVSGYQIMMEEMGLYENVKGFLLLNIKENGEFQEKRSVSLENHKRAFLACLEIYRQKEKTNNML